MYVWPTPRKNRKGGSSPAAREKAVLFDCIHPIGMNAGENIPARAFAAVAHAPPPVDHILSLKNTYEQKQYFAATRPPPRFPFGLGI